MIRILSALCGALLILLGVQTWRIDRLKAEPVKADLHTAQHVIVRSAKADTITQATGERSSAAVTQIRYVTRTQIEKVPVYVTAETDRRYPLPWGAVRLYDASVLGLDPSALPNPAGEPDDAPSTVAASAFATVATGNNGQCLEDRQRLIDLQQWVRDEAALWNASVSPATK